MVSKLFRAYGLYNAVRADIPYALSVSKLFRAYGLYNESEIIKAAAEIAFQSSFELTGYITEDYITTPAKDTIVSKLFRAYGLYNSLRLVEYVLSIMVSKLFRAYGLYNLVMG